VDLVFEDGRTLDSADDLPGLTAWNLPDDLGSSFNGHRRSAAEGRGDDVDLR
jgi:hypothetical protein